MSHYRKERVMTRFTLIVLALLGTPAMAAGQSSALDRGSLLVDGNASFVSAGVEGADTRNTILSVRPGVKYFIIPRLAVGGQLLVGYASGGDVTRTSLGIGPAMDYYFGALSNALHPFVSGSIFLGTERTDRPGFDTDVRQVRYRGAAGVLYLFTEQVGLNGALFYEKTEDTVGDDAVGRDSYGLSFGVAAFVF